MMSDSSPRSATRQRTRQQQRGHLSRSTLLALVGVALVGLVAGVGLTQRTRVDALYTQAQNDFIAWTTEQGFSVQNVNLTGRKQVSSAFIMGALQIERGMPILRYDPKTAQERLIENPWIKNAKIERRLPDTVFIRITERVPAARWQVGGKLVLVDAEGVVLSTDVIQHYHQLPIIIGQDVRHRLVDLFALLAGEPSIGKQVVAATWIGNRRWDLTLQNRMVVRLSAKDPQLALTHLAALARDENVLNRDVTAIDLRLPDKAVLTPTGRANALIERPNFNDLPDLSKKNI